MVWSRLRHSSVLGLLLQPSYLWLLVILASVRSVLIERPKNATRYIGESVEFVCATNIRQPNGEPLPVYWEFNSPSRKGLQYYEFGYLTQRYEGKIYVNESTPWWYPLVVYNIGMDDAGQYRCVDESGIGRDEASAFLSVVNQFETTVNQFETTANTTESIVDETVGSKGQRQSHVSVAISVSVVVTAVIVAVVVIIWKLKHRRVLASLQSVTVSDINANSCVLSWPPYVFSGNPENNDVDSRLLITYIVELKITGSSTWIKVDVINEQSHTIRGLKAGTEYQFRVTAKNKVGRSNPSDILKCSTLPIGPPQRVQMEEMGTNSYVLTWETPQLDDNAAKINKYYVENLNEYDKWIVIGAVNGETYRMELKDLAEHIKYVFRVKAENDFGVGETSKATDEIFIKSKPGQPLEKGATNNENNYITLMWNSPNDTGNSTILGYTVEYKDVRSKTWIVYNWNRKITDTMCKVEWLNEMSGYEFRVSAHNEVDQGEPSETITSSILPGLSEPTTFHTKRLVEQRFTISLDRTVYVMPVSEATKDDVLAHLEIAGGGLIEAEELNGRTLVVCLKSEEVANHMLEKKTLMVQGVECTISKRPPEKTYRMLKDSSKCSRYINILLLGETGVGKSTWINGFANYLTYTTLQEAMDEGMITLIPMSFTMTDNDHNVISAGKADENEHHQKDGQSCTQYPKTYRFCNDYLSIRLIDTPGIGDTRGIEQDKENFNSMLAHIATFEELHGIFILLKPNQARSTVQFEYCIKELLKNLHKDACRNIVVVFTNARSTFYQPGDTMPAIRRVFQESKVEIPLDRQRVYCIDNEAVRFLAAVTSGKIKFKTNQEQVYTESWNTTVTETGRLMKYISSLHPHLVKYTLSIHNSRHMIIGVTGPLAEMTVIIQNTLAAIKAKRNELTESTENEEELETRIAELQKEQHYITRASAKFACFLKMYAVTPYNDMMDDYLQYYIKHSENLLYDNAKLKGLKKIHTKYLQEIKDLQTAMKNSKETPPTPDEIKLIITNVYHMKHFGEKIKQTATIIEEAENEDLREREVIVPKVARRSSRSLNILQQLTQGTEV